MRPIKFRAWDKRGKKMILPPSPYDSQIGLKFFTLDGRCYIGGVHQKYELLQYTGLKDKNGKEIYEGDIIYSINIFIRHIPLVVQFENGTFLAKTATPRKDIEGIRNLVDQPCEIIGNIYEHPELLKEKAPGGEK
jgi:uncharacterized phage protein (TIGR01671 family)